jgi:hypothetical protein
VDNCLPAEKQPKFVSIDGETFRVDDATCPKTKNNEPMGDDKQVGTHYFNHHTWQKWAFGLHMKEYSRIPPYNINRAVVTGS